MNPFSHVNESECLAWRTRLLNRIVSGSQTRVAHGPGQADEFAEKTHEQLLELLQWVNERLFELDPNTYDDPNESNRPGVTRMNYDTGI